MTKPRPAPKSASPLPESKGAPGAPGVGTPNEAGGEIQPNEPMETEGSFQDGEGTQTD